MRDPADRLRGLKKTDFYAQREPFVRKLNTVVFGAGNIADLGELRRAKIPHPQTFTE
jgi:hypothetical protein